MFDAVERYITGLRAVEDGTAQVADRLGEAMGVGIPDVIAAVRAAAATGSLREGRIILLENGLATSPPEDFTVAFAGRAGGKGTAGGVTVSTGVMRPRDVGALSAKASREGIAGLSHVEVLVLVLVWLLAGEAGPRAVAAFERMRRPAF